MFELLFTHPLWAWRTGTFAFASGWPRWVLWVCVAAGAVLIVLSLLRRRSIGAGKLAIIGTLQALFVALSLALLWRPVLHVERVRDRENVLAVAIDASASMAIADDPGADAPQSRLQHAVAALQSNALAALQKSFEVRLFAFSSRTESLPSLESMPAPGTQTRIGDSLVQLLQTASSVPLAGVVLLSDGAENGQTLSEERLAEIAAFGVPVHTVGVGAESIPHDLELDQVRVAQVAPSGSTVTASVRIRHDAPGSTRLRVYDHDRLLAAKALELPATATVSSHRIEFPVGAPGTHDLRFTLDALDGERDVLNNTRSQVLSVPVERRRILYVEGEPRWEYKFLRRAVEPERSLQLTSAVRTTPNKYFRQGVRSGDELQNGFPADPAELFAYDAVIIGSFDAANLSVQQHQLLRQFVDRRGGSVLLLAGSRGLSAGGWERTALSQTLPLHLPDRQAQSFVQRTASVRPTPYAADSAITRFDAEPARNAEQWQSLPKLADYQSLGRLKPGAIVLLEATAEQGTAPLLVWQRFGQGATYVLGTASTLRWQMRLAPDDQRHELFWRQLAHAIADGATPRVTLASEKTVYDDERQIRMEAELRNARFEPIDAAQVELLVAPERDEPFRVPMQPSDAGPGRYVASFDAPATGLYRVDMSARAPDGDLQFATAYVRRNEGLLEHFGLRQDKAVLARIAAMTGGRYWKLDELDQLAAAIPYSRAGIVERQTLDLWNLPVVFLALLALLAVEWLLRLKWGRL
ncbi:MAG TPA: hypothetical protein PKE27_16370 [Povalibacter sp.]|uniref:hypothetical protein n=1 Tax=Povalibacter sp. TaxID=1962978 RepID=UPI002BA1226A|nr:hypothetical protein [Povalibacter sp.]HMN46155.1 hypothetical protein [Povalibacter sp.]